VLVVANHISYLDPVFSAVFVHRAKRVPRFLAKASIWKVPVAGWTMAGSGQIPVYRDSADAQHSLRAGIQALHDGKLVLIYRRAPSPGTRPAGRCTPDRGGPPCAGRRGAGGADGALGHPRCLRPLQRQEVPADPAQGRRGARRSPLDLSAYRNRPVDAALLREVTDFLMTGVRDLLAEVRQEPAPADFYRRGRTAGGPVEGDAAS